MPTRPGTRLTLSVRQTLEWWYWTTYEHVMIKHVQACSACSKHVSSMFSKPEQAEHAIDCKMAIFSLTMFHYLFACSGMFSMFSMFRSCFKHVTCMFMHVSYVLKHWTYTKHAKHDKQALNMPNMLNMLPPLGPTFWKGSAKGRQHVLAMFWDVQSMLEHVQCFFSSYT